MKFYQNLYFLHDSTQMWANAYSQKVAQLKIQSSQAQSYLDCSIIYKCCLNQNYTIIKKKRLLTMRRIFLRPFFDFHEPFFPIRRVLTPTYRLRVIENPQTTRVTEVPQKNDPHAIFNQFFKENQFKDEAEREFFKKHFPETVEEKFDPYKVLEINNDASIDLVKEAYRKLALKYHPKNNTSPDAEAKFAEISKAYEAILQTQNAKNVDEFGFKSFFQEFEKQVDSIFNTKASIQTPEQTKNQKEIKDEGKQNKNDEQFGELYSESSSYESLNGEQTKFVVEKIYKKDGKFLKVLRQQKLKEDGKIEITQTIDNGQQVKKKTFTQEKDTKKLTSG